jgi:hypothetical protein
MYEFQIKKMRNIQKSRYTFKVDTSSATIGQPVKGGQFDSRDYVIPLSNLSVKFGREVIASGLSGEIYINESDLMDTAEEDGLYERMYAELITSRERKLEEEHGNDDDFGELEEQLWDELIKVNRRLDDAFDNISYELLSIGRIPAISFKGFVYDGDSELEDEYVDELKMKFTCRLSIPDFGEHEITAETDSASFVPSDGMIDEMISYMEMENEETE